MSANLVMGLDVGTTKTCCVVCEIDENEGVNVIGIGMAPSRGLRKGVVVNIEATTQSITQAVAEAEKMADCLIDYVFVGIAGAHISSFNSKGVVAVGGEDHEITRSDVERAIEAAKTVAIPPNREIIHILPRYFTVDDQDGIRDPIGMSGVRLEADVHIIMGASTSVQNLVKSCHKAHLDVATEVLESVASADAVLNGDEKELGVALVDMGGGTTNVAIFHSGSIVHSAVLPVGGQNVTNDIAVGLRTTSERAEELKIKSGCAKAEMVDGEKTLDVLNTGGQDSRKLPLKGLCEIIEPRMEEIFELIRQEIERSGCYDMLPAGVVLTGGASQIRGGLNLAEEVLGLPVRLGRPIGLKGLADKVSNPIFSTAIGLIHYGVANQGALGGGHLHGASVVDIVIDKVRSWFSEIF